MSKPKDFETALQRLEEIVKKLDSGDLPLASLLEVYEEGVILSLGPVHSFPLMEVFRYLRPCTVRETLVHAVLEHADNASRNRMGSMAVFIRILLRALCVACRPDRHRVPRRS